MQGKPKGRHEPILQWFAVSILVRSISEHRKLLINIVCSVSWRSRSSASSHF